MATSILHDERRLPDSTPAVRILIGRPAVAAEPLGASRPVAGLGDRGRDRLDERFRSPPPRPASPQDVGTVENLDQLADLHERGLLTDNVAHLSCKDHGSS